MKFRQLLPVVIGLLLMGAPVVGSAEPGTPVSVSTSSAAVEETAGTEAQAPKPWESVVVTDELEKNNKTQFYTRKPEQEKLAANGKLVAYFPGILPSGVREDLQYTRYPVPKEYLFQLAGAAAIKGQPRFGAASVKTLGRFQHIEVDGIVQGELHQNSGSRDWYRVRWGSAENPQTGYIHSASTHRRGFQFGKMIQSADRLRALVENGKVAHVDNYKNRSGWAPRHGGQDADDFGLGRDQSAPAYFQPDTAGDFRYLTDGALVSVLGETGDFMEVSPVDFEGVYYVPKKYLPPEPKLTALNKVVVVDRKNQNEAVFERAGQEWKLISYLMATTGENAKFKQETSLGNFMVIEKKSKFMYLGDISKEIEGYAPFALRFNGGAYIHGVPVNYKSVTNKVVVQQPVLDPLGNIITPAVTRDVVVGRKDPGIQEYLSSIGTTPRSHKCVRNYTSHAKFLYDWAEIGSTAVIVIE